MLARWRTLALIALLGVPALARAAEATTTPPSTQAADKLDQVLRDLVADDWKLRQQAGDALSEIDPSQLPRLRKLIETTTDVDLRTTLLAAVARIEERSIISPSLVTLHVSNASAATVLEALGKQVQFGLVTDSFDWLDTVKVSADIDGQPFWSAMKTLAPQWPVRVSPSPNDAGRLRLYGVGNDYLNPRSVVAGPFLVSPISLQTAGSVDLLAAAPAFKFRSVMLQLAVLAEPKLRASRVRIAAQECVDEKGAAIKTSDAAVGALTETPVSQASTGMIRLFPQADAGKKIARLSGVIRFRLPFQTRRTVLADLAPGKETKLDLGGRQVRIVLVQQDKEYLVKLALPANVNMQDELSMSMVRDMSLLDAAGNPLFRRNTTQAMTGQSWEFSTIFAREGISFGPGVKSTGEPAKLVWDLPTESKNLEQPFELKEIPLGQ